MATRRIIYDDDEEEDEFQKFDPSMSKSRLAFEEDDIEVTRRNTTPERRNIIELDDDDLEERHSNGKKVSGKDAFKELMAGRNKSNAATTLLGMQKKNDEKNSNTKDLNISRLSTVSGQTRVDSDSTPKPGAMKNSRKRFSVDTVKFALSTAKVRRVLGDKARDSLEGDIRMSTESMRAISELLTVFVSEATLRAKDEAEKEDDLSQKHLKPIHLVKVLPKLLLDL